MCKELKYSVVVVAEQEMFRVVARLRSTGPISKDDVNEVIMMQMRNKGADLSKPVNVIAILCPDLEKSQKLYDMLEPDSVTVHDLEKMLEDSGMPGGAFEMRTTESLH